MDSCDVTSELAENFLKMLANQQHLKILFQLQVHELSTAELDEATHLSKEDLSACLARLGRAGLISNRHKDGKIVYRLGGGDVERVISLIGEMFCRCDEDHDHLQASSLIEHPSPRDER